MLLQIASFEEDGDALEEGVRHVRAEVVPSIDGAEGLIAAYWAVDRENGRRVSVMVWEGPEAAAAAPVLWFFRLTQQGSPNPNP